MKCIHFYHLEYSDYYLHSHYYTHNVLTDISFGLLKVFYVELRSSQNFELNPLFNPWGQTVLIPLTMTGYNC